MEAYFVGAARMFHVLVSGLSMLDGVLGSSAMKGSFIGESLLARHSPVGTGKQATGRVDVPGENQIVAAAVAAAAASSPPPKEKVETNTWQILVRTLTGRTVTLQVSTLSLVIALFLKRLVSWLAPSTFSVVAGFGGWRDGMGLQPRDTLHMVGRLLGGARPPAVFIPASGLARRVAWTGAGQAWTGAFDAWLAGPRVTRRMLPGLFCRVWGLAGRHGSATGDTLHMVGGCWAVLDRHRCSSRPVDLHDVWHVRVLAKHGRVLSMRGSQARG